jgi:conjugal transfer pilus assembly protein TraB
MNPMNLLHSLSPEKRKIVIFILLAVLLVSVSLFAYQLRKPSYGDTKKVVKTKDITDLGEGEGLLEESLYLESKKKTDELNRRFDALEKRLESLTPPDEEKAASFEETETRIRKEGDIPPLPAPSEYRSFKSTPPPPPPSESKGFPAFKSSSEQPMPTTTLIGDIGITTVPEDEEEIKKKEGKRLYLPPSFMPATLLSGLDAPTSGGGDKKAVPALFRIKDLAILPNRVKANLKGCFVIAEGQGELSTERIEMRLVSLSCIDKQGNAVIDQEVMGFVIDEDGKIGLKGHVVAKFGSMVARSMLAGFIGGIGKGVQQSSLDVIVSPEGYVSTADETEDIVKAGIGGGIERATQETEKFFIELARETKPVLEVGNSKPVTIVVSKGAELSIKNYCFEEDGLCEDTEDAL